MKTMKKNIRRTFQRSWARFLSVTLLIMLAIFVFVGLFSAGPDMRQTVIDRFKQENLADIQVETTTSFSDSDKKRLEQVANLKEITYGKQIDAVLSGKGIRVISTPKTISKAKLVQGRLPQTNNEIAIGEQLNQKIGDTISITSDDLKVKKLTVVGIVRSSEFMSRTSLGQTNVGDGTLSYFAIVPSSNMTVSDNLARLTFTNTQNLSAYTQEYSNAAYADLEKVQKITRQLTQAKQDKSLTDITAAEEKLASSEKTLAQQEETVKTAQEQLQAAKQTAVASPELQAQLADQESRLSKQAAQLSQAKTELVETKSDLAQKKKQVSLIQVTAQERSDFAHGYSDYGSSATRMDALALVLPVIFFAISLMVSFTTMRRMVAEKRTEMGTLRALGFYKKEVMGEFTLYSTLSALVGTVGGSLLGIYFLPNRIYSIFADGSYQLGKMTIVYNIPLLLISLGLALMSTLLAAYLAAKKELKEKPADLMLPKPPAVTNTILLERIPLIWKHLSFSNKVTLRNAFRYKSRMFMTIFGVMGSISLLILGIGIRDSLIELPHRQYETISTYDMIAVYNSDSKSLSSYQNLVKTHSSSQTSIRYETVSAKSDELLDSQSIQLFVGKDFKNDIQLDHRLTNDGAILSKKLAQAFNLEQGDYLTIKDSQGKSYHIKVSSITSNYVGHMIYMTPTYYQKVFGTAYQSNAYLLKTKENAETLAKKLNQNDASLTVVQSKVIRQTVSDFLGGLTNIILIIVFVSILLVYIVLYTLTSINVAEREKELATIKVLGFYQKETLLYVFKETFLLTAIGILLGIGLGYFLHKYVMTVIPPEHIFSIPGITWTNILISTVAVILFSFIVMAIMNRHIKRIDMLEALKSVD
ncbi:FtsX-like permease family protein [Streptococcus ferus]|uniref:FtsX-like permease family protein n=1 Tax=Streptococcus ferus TaxID=1345 RepID=UPI0035A0DC40